MYWKIVWQIQYQHRWEFYLDSRNRKNSLQFLEAHRLYLNASNKTTKPLKIEKSIERKKTKKKTELFFQMSFFLNFEDKTDGPKAFWIYRTINDGYFFVKMNRSWENWMNCSYLLDQPNKKFPFSKSEVDQFFRDLHTFAVRLDSAVWLPFNNGNALNLKKLILCDAGNRFRQLRKNKIGWT